jgi:hypothetical protein
MQQKSLPIVTQLVNKFLDCHDTQKLINMFTTAHHWTLSLANESSSHTDTPYFSFQYYIPTWYCPFMFPD